MRGVHRRGVGERGYVGRGPFRICVDRAPDDPKLSVTCAPGLAATNRSLIVVNALVRDARQRRRWILIFRGAGNHDAAARRWWCGCGAVGVGTAAGDERASATNTARATAARWPHRRGVEP